MKRIISIAVLLSVLAAITSCVKDEDEPQVNPGGGPTTPTDTTTTPADISVAKEVDLGLSVMWSGYNLGATSPEQYGDYYAWGELATKDNFATSTYGFDNYGRQNISGTSRDVVYQQMGGEWHMPTQAELEELVENCVTEAITYKGVKGFKIIGPNGNSIFLPAAGYKKGTTVYAKELQGHYWTGTSDGKAKVTIQSLYSTGTLHSIYYYYGLHYYGLPIRPVKGLLPTTLEDFVVFAQFVKDDMVKVDGGTFTMGATSEQGSDAYGDEKPAHEVTLEDYYIGRYEVTKGLWECVMNYSGTAADGTTMSAYASDVRSISKSSSSYGVDDYYPANYVSYNKIVDVFLPRLNKITGKSFRLPTEAEWEYAARGGNKSKGYKYSGSNTLGDVAWYYDNAYSVGLNSSDYGAHQVGTKSPNELGLYDMSGNVWEWCNDWYDHGYYSSSPSTNPTGPSTGPGRVIRGGDWSGGGSGRILNDRMYRVAYRYYSSPSGAYDNLGFRLACSAL